MRPDPEAIVAAIARATGARGGSVPLHEPHFGGREWEYLKQCLDSGWVSTAGKFVEEFEAQLAARCGTRFAVATMNGTAALHAALLALGVQPGDEVIVPALTFVATANAVAHCGAVPHLADSTENGLGMDPVALRAHLADAAIRRDGGLVNRASGRRIRALVPVHVFGHPCDMQALNALGSELGIAVLEDATESLGSLYRGRPCGGLGRAGVLSFNGNKIVTTGGGGAVVTDDEALARALRHLTTTAKQPHRWAFNHDAIAWNYRMPNLNAALGLAQLEQLDGFVAAKRRLAARYRDAFADVAGVRWVREPEGTESNYWLNAILLDDDSGRARDAVLEATHAAGYLTRPAWTLMHRLPMYAAAPRAPLPVAESIERRLVNLPSSPSLQLRPTSAGSNR